MIDDKLKKQLGLTIEQEAKLLVALERLGRGDAFLHTNVEFALFENGIPKQHTVTAHNLITLTGRNLVRDLLGGDQNKEPTHAVLGTDNTEPNDLDIALGNEVYRDVITRRIKESSKISFQLFVSENDANGNVLTEAALINQNPTFGDALFARVIFNPINKTPSISFTLTWEVNITSS